jgi:hypothetical protein
MEIWKDVPGFEGRFPSIRQAEEIHGKAARDFTRA